MFGNFANTDNKKILFTVLINLILYGILFASTVILLKGEIKTDFNSLCKKRATSVFGICGIGLGAGYLGNFIGSTIVSILGGADSSLNQSGIETLMFSKYAIIMVIIVVFIGPIVEELVFRKALHDFLRSLKFPVWLILIISSLLFGFIHVLDEGDLVQVFPYIFMGVALGGVELYSKNIYPSILVHIFINALSTSLIFFYEIIGVMG